jgi:hypothetical protein
MKKMLIYCHSRVRTRTQTKEYDANLNLITAFTSTNIPSDLPGRISPGPTTSSSIPSANLYETAGRINTSFENSTKSGGIFALDSYTGYFDVDTMTVLTRCWKTLLPREDYVEGVLDGNVDLYGAFPLAVSYDCRCQR